MSYTKTTWIDRVVQFPRRFLKSGETSTEVTLDASPGAVTQAGTPVNAALLNKLEQGVADAHQSIATINTPGFATDIIIGNRTIDDTLTPNTGPNTLTNLLSFLGKMIRQITGKSSWITAPRTTLENAVKLNGDDMSGPLGFGSAVGDKVRLYTTTYGFGINPGEMTVYTGDGAPPKLRTGAWNGTIVGTFLTTGNSLMTRESAGIPQYSIDGGVTWKPMGNIKVGRQRRGSLNFNADTGPHVANTWYTLVNVTGAGRLHELWTSGNLGTSSFRVTLDGVVETTASILGNIFLGHFNSSSDYAAVEPIYFGSSLKMEVMGSTSGVFAVTYEYALALGTP